MPWPAADGDALARDAVARHPCDRRLAEAVREPEVLALVARLRGRLLRARAEAVLGHLGAGPDRIPRDRAVLCPAIDTRTWTSPARRPGSKPGGSSPRRSARAAMPSRKSCGKLSRTRRGSRAPRGRRGNRDVAGRRRLRAPLGLGRHRVGLRGEPLRAPPAAPRSSRTRAKSSAEREAVAAQHVALDVVALERASCGPPRPPRRCSVGRVEPLGALRERGEPPRAGRARRRPRRASPRASRSPRSPRRAGWPRPSARTRRARVVPG